MDMIKARVVMGNEPHSRTAATSADPQDGHRKISLAFFLTSFSWKCKRLHYFFFLNMMLD
jgi:hypothetical protein